MKLAIIVSHPIQYYTPLYQRLARRDDLSLKVYFTWHAGREPVHDRGFNIPVAWDIPLTVGYDFEAIRNVASDPGTHHFLGLRNPSLVDHVASWQPDVVHVTGWAWASHLAALRTFSRRRVPVLFRGDSHLLDSPQMGPRWWIKRALLRQVYRLPTTFLTVGSANRAYYEAFGVEPDRLCNCPHSIDVGRFAGNVEVFEAEAREWRRSLDIADTGIVVLYAGKFERKKRPLELMRALQQIDDPNAVLVLVGGGELEAQVQGIAGADSRRFRVLPFQNQSRMPVVYRLGDLFVLPSAFGETWGLAVNEALASGRAVLVSDRVGCAADVINEFSGRNFRWNDLAEMTSTIRDMISDKGRLRRMGVMASSHAWNFDIVRSERAVVTAMKKVLET